jgi:hypothetical protein
VVVEAIERGWERLANGALLDAAEAAGFELFVTADKNIRYHQNLTGRKISIVVLGNAQWPILRRYVDRVVAAVSAATPGTGPMYSDQNRFSGSLNGFTPSAGLRNVVRG